MNYEVDKDILNKKIDQEFFKFKQDLIEKYTSKEIINKAYEIAVKEQIADEIKFRNFDNSEIKALLKQDDLLNEFYSEWLSEDTRLGEILDTSIDETIEFITDNYEKNKQKIRESR